MPIFETSTVLTSGSCALLSLLATFFSSVSKSVVETPLKVAISAALSISIPFFSQFLTKFEKDLLVELSFHLS